MSIWATIHHVVFTDGNNGTWAQNTDIKWPRVWAYGLASVFVASVASFRADLCQACHSASGWRSRTSQRPLASPSTTSPEISRTCENKIRGGLPYALSYLVETGSLMHSMILTKPPVYSHLHIHSPCAPWFLCACAWYIRQTKISKKTREHPKRVLTLSKLRAIIQECQTMKCTWWG